ncbi:MAG TPA: Crp/Fnr family transcriptional regulator [Flavisolibacter sp.]|nr:Crp/Fnr family transcriptional regulator [Flavisolibacter sp.]
MDYQVLRASFQNYITLTEKEWQLVSSLITERSFKRGEFISKEGEINRFSNFIESGSVRVFYIGNDGQEHVVQLGVRGWWIGDFPSFITQSKGLLYVEALAPTNILAFTYENLQLLYQHAPLFERFFRLLVEKAYAAFQYRILHNIGMDAEQRYIFFSKTYPLLDQQIPQKHIASYLGISAEFFSKIKKRIHEKRQESGI